MNYDTVTRVETKETKITFLIRLPAQLMGELLARLGAARFGSLLNASAIDSQELCLLPITRLCSNNESVSSFGKDEGGSRSEPPR